MRLVNLAHGDLIVLGAFLILGATSLGVPLVVACAIVVPLMFAVGYALQSLLLNRALGRNILPPLLITFGLSIIVQNGLLETFSADTPPPRRRAAAKRVAAARRRRRDRGHAADLPRSRQSRSSLLLNGVFYRTAAGPGVPRDVRRRRDRAAHGHQQSLDLRADDGNFARRLRAGGILPRHARQFRSQRRTGASPLAFEAVIIGGLGSLWGTLAGGIVVGLAQTVGAHIDPEWQILSGHIAFLIVLVIRPRGLFPRAVD